MNSVAPRVSIGMPVYNGAKYIREALDSLLAQTHRDFELIVSDNASTDDTAEICRAYASADPRIRYSRVSENIGVARNFERVLQSATADFFMWAAHDDRWEPFFVSDCLAQLESLGSDYVAVVLEAQYFSDSQPFDFVAEGRAFYASDLPDTGERLRHLLDNNYGNLFYSLYRRQSLFVNGVSVLSLVPYVSLNEIPAFLAIALQGQWRVLPKVGWYKRTTSQTYAQARWEFEGGRLPGSHLFPLLRAGSIKTSLHYHRRALGDITAMLRALPIEQTLRRQLLGHVQRGLARHLCWLGLGYKPRRNP